ncbi:MAG: hypothetical protein ACK52J_04195 [bacterium]
MVLAEESLVEVEEKIEIEILKLEEANGLVIVIEEVIAGSVIVNMVLAFVISEGNIIKI